MERMYGEMFGESDRNTEAKLNITGECLLFMSKHMGATRYARDDSLCLLVGSLFLSQCCFLQASKS